MAIHPIVTFPGSVLKETAKPVTKFDAELEALVQDMIETMYDAPGVGLAAPQIGVSLQLAVVDHTAGRNKNALMVLANPKIVAAEGEQTDEEGCLSVSDYTSNVTRFEKITVEAQDLKGHKVRFEAEGFLARVVQHELDHLNGTLFIDRISSLKRSLYKKKLKKILKAQKEEEPEA
jgi:peptide deformylase